MVYRDMKEAFQAENIMTPELKIVMIDEDRKNARLTLVVSIAMLLPASGRNNMIHRPLVKDKGFQP